MSSPRLRPFAAILSLLFPFILSSTAAHAADQHQIVLAEDPVQLLKLLPPAPRGWALTTSRGIGQVTNAPALRTSAIREYKFTPPAKSPGQPAPQEVTRITFTDTGYDPDGLFQFNNFVAKPQAPPNAGGPPANYLMNGCPVIEVLTPQKRIVLISIAHRFCLVMELTNEDEAGGDSWIQQVNLPQLMDAAAKAPEDPLPPHQIKVTFVDELNPKDNQESFMPYLTQGEQAAQKKAIEEGH